MIYVWNHSAWVHGRRVSSNVIHVYLTENGSVKRSVKIMSARLYVKIITNLLLSVRNSFRRFNCCTHNTSYARNVAVVYTLHVYYTSQWAMYIIMLLLSRLTRCTQYNNMLLFPFTCVWVCVTDFGVIEMLKLRLLCCAVYMYIYA